MLKKSDSEEIVRGRKCVLGLCLGASGFIEIKLSTAAKKRGEINTVKKQEDVAV